MTRTTKSPEKDKAVVKVAKFGSESGHWYDEHGQLIEQCLKADGKSYTKTTLRHARKLNLAPGVTTITGCADKPQLTLWKQRQAIMSALTLPRHDAETEAEWMARVEHDMQQTARKAADEGTRIHAAIESHMRGDTFDAAYVRHVEAVTDLLAKHCGDQLSRWLPERGVASVLGYGTKADLHSEEWLVDFKGCDGDQEELDQKKTWDNHHMQLGATREPIARELRCAIIYVSRTHHGVAAFKEVPEEKLRQGFGMFRGLLAYWQAKNNHCPDWATGAF